jgi:hypothetical protein
VELGGLASINDTLAWVFTEMMGNLVAKSSYAFAGQELGRQIRAWGSKTTTGNKRTITDQASRGKGGL